MTKPTFSTLCFLLGLLWLGLLLRPTPVATQASLVAPEYCAFDLNGAPLVGGTLTSYVAGTTTPLALYSDFALTTPHPNPVTLNGRGCVVAYMQPATYRFVLRDSAGVQVYDVTIVSSPALHTVNLDVQATAGETVGAGQLVFLADGSDSTTAGRWHLADADLASKSSQARTVGITLGAITVGGTGSVRVQGRVTGLSGLTPGAPYYASATAGALAASPPANRRYVGMAETTSTFVMAAGILDATTPVLPSITVNGASTFNGAVTATVSGPHSITASSTGGVILNVRNTNTGTGALGRVSVGNDATADGLLIEHHSTGYTTAGPSLQDGAAIRAARAGGLSLAAVHASGAVRIYAGGSLTPTITANANGTATIRNFVVPEVNPVPSTLHNFDLQGGSIVIYTSTLGDATITGFAGGSAGRQIWVLRSPAATGSLTLAAENAGSTAANRITVASGSAGDIVLAAGASVVHLVYDVFSSRWLAFEVEPKT